MGAGAEEGETEVVVLPTGRLEPEDAGSAAGSCLDPAQQQLPMAPAPRGTATRRTSGRKSGGFPGGR
ncbi:hypothetical protein PR202_gb01651 [Eleusine coracana subsp. coracana]|uniref:Uncharacterized protein n=1 Tax=Eleusine coracana subsp. coracana TaxID=191504 RepID=A0AAV5DWS2_ELECO|nr:hypothetical protein PR202_gb01651 [Eleusine coracana subsp. coracana]